MNNKQLRDKVLKQLSYDVNGNIKDFQKNTNIIYTNGFHQKRRFLFKNPNYMYAVCTGDNVVINCDPGISEYLTKFISKMPGYRMFDSIQTEYLNKKFHKVGKRISNVVQFYLPNADKFQRIREPRYKIEVLLDQEIHKLYTDKRFSMALHYKIGDIKKDIIAVVAYDNNNEIMGVAAATNESEFMCGIGIDVIEKYRKKGIASDLVNIITDEILKMNLIPYYATAIGNMASKKVAYNNNYYPMWIEMYVEDIIKTDKYVKRFFD